MIEVKIYCECGSKFKFDVEPVDGHLPAPVSCPVCGRDATPRANTILRLSLSPEPSAQKSLTINIQNTAQPAPAQQQPRAELRAHAAPVAAPAPTPQAAPRQAQPAVQPRSSVGSLWKIRPAYALLSFAAVAGAVYWFGFAARTDHPLSQFPTTGSAHSLPASIKTPDADPTSAKHTADSSPKSKKSVDRMATKHGKEWNFKANNQVIVYVQHEGADDVANALPASFEEYITHKFKVASQNTTRDDGLQFTVKPLHNGYVQIIGGLTWTEEQFDATARYLSEKFQTVVFVEKDARSRKEFLFEAYEQGVKTFLISADAATPPTDFPNITADQAEWAMIHGYKPGPKGFTEFGLVEANDLTKKCGLQLWDESPSTVNNQYIVVADPDAIAKN